VPVSALRVHEPAQVFPTGQQARGKGEPARGKGEPARGKGEPARADADERAARRPGAAGAGAADLAATLPGTELAMEVEVLARWLESSRPRSWPELDARTVVSLLAADGRLNGARLGMECLASGDSIGAAAAYQRLRRRSRVLTEISRLS
jgi:hypothetical protein